MSTVTLTAPPKHSTTRVQLAKRILGGMTLTAMLAVAAPVYAADLDEDGIDDAIDNCLGVKNPDQRDSDGDGIGNPCDADLNNDVRVNSLDLGLFKKAFNTTNATADLNGDGVVNSLDLGIFKRLFGKPPGPTAVKLDPKFVADPPVATDTSLALLESPGPNGANAILTIQFEREQQLPRVISIVPEDRVFPLNDMGIEPDTEAGDSIYSGYARFDVEKYQQAVNAFLDQEGKLPERPLLYSFFGREVSKISDWVSPQVGAAGAPIKAAALPPLVPFKLLPFFKIPLFPVITNKARTLAITNLSVVADPTRTWDPCDTDGDGTRGNPNGPWSFKTLMTNMANTPVTGLTGKQFVHAWLKQWLSNDTVNSFLITNRAFGMQNEILNHIPSWDPLDSNALNLDQVPLRLLAIINRIDLAGASTYGPGQPGELRFVFGLLKDGDNPATCRPHPLGMGVILEYGVPITSCLGLKNWANQWINLDTMNPPFPSPAYNAALETMTNVVSLANAVPGKPNGSAINQIRTNEVALDFPWQLLEFTLQNVPPAPAVAHTLEHDTVKQTPDFFKNFSIALRDFININEPAILLEKHVVPLTFPGAVPFRGAAMDYNPGFFFNAAGILNPTARHKFSLNTCGGCHAAEALNPAVALPSPPFAPGTPESFYHVDARTPAGLPVRLSRFMTGTATTAPFTAIPDPAAGVPSRHFNDLQKRGQKLQTFATQSCFALPVIFTPIQFVH